MPLASRRLFMDVHTALFATFGSFHALTIQNRRTRLRVASSLGAHFLNQHFIDAFPQALAFPAPKIAIDCLPGWKVGRQHPPLAARSYDIQNGIQDLLPLPYARPS